MTAIASLERYEAPSQMILFKSRFALMSNCNGAPSTYFRRTDGFNLTCSLNEKHNLWSENSVF